MSIFFAFTTGLLLGGVLVWLYVAGYVTNLERRNRETVNNLDDIDVPDFMKGH